MTLKSRVQQFIWTHALDTIVNHVPPWELDEVLVAGGLVIGPCQHMDTVGLNRVAEMLQASMGRNILLRMVSEGRLGRAASWGFYRYTHAGQTIVDPLIDDLILEELRFAGVSRREVDDSAILAGFKVGCADFETALVETGAPNQQVEQAMCDGLHCHSAGWWR